MRGTIAYVVWLALVGPCAAVAACGTDHDGGTVGDTIAAETSAPDTYAVSPTGLIDCSCDQRECGPTPCGGRCGYCPDGSSVCRDGQCLSSCPRACEGRTCGDDGCHGVCGVCGPYAPICDDGHCIPKTCTQLSIRLQADPPAFGQELTVTAATAQPPQNAPLASWRWTLRQPDGPPLVGPNAPSWTVLPTRSGRYEFSLTAADESGKPACREVTREITALAPGSPTHVQLRVELTWTTPGDHDETDTGFDPFGASRGSDVDLHLLHPDAVGLDVDGDNVPDGWYDETHDVRFGNRSPHWPEPTPGATSPTLTLDDADGAGPEMLIFAVPEPGRTYKVGVHYWDDNGYGPSIATVRIFVRGELAYTSPGVNLERHDLWSVASVAWPSGEVVEPTRDSDAPVIHPFLHPANTDHPFGE